MSKEVHHHYGASIGIGNVIAVLLSWTANHSIIWAIIHGLLSWLYVIAYVLGMVHK